MIGMKRADFSTPTGQPRTSRGDYRLRCHRKAIDLLESCFLSTSTTSRSEESGRFGQSRRALSFPPLLEPRRDTRDLFLMDSAKLQPPRGFGGKAPEEEAAKTEGSVGTFRVETPTSVITNSSSGEATPRSSLCEDEPAFAFHGESELAFHRSGTEIFGILTRNAGGRRSPAALLSPRQPRRPCPGPSFAFYFSPLPLGPPFFI